jgi:hypothetical protein
LWGKRRSGGTIFGRTRKLFVVFLFFFVLFWLLFWLVRSFFFWLFFGNFFFGNFFFGNFFLRSVLFGSVFCWGYIFVGH